MLLRMVWNGLWPLRLRMSSGAVVVRSLVSVILGVHPAAVAAVAAGTPSSVGERLRLAENLARYITGIPTPLCLHCAQPRTGYDHTAWPHALAAAWRAVASGVAAMTAAQWLWPAYLDRVSTWLADTSTMATRAQTLRAAATELLLTLTTTRKSS